MTQPQKVIDMKLPLSWLISSAVAVLFFMASMVWSIAGQSNKLDLVLITSAKLEKRLDERDAKQEISVREQYAIQRVQDAQAIRIEALERAVRK